MKDTTTTTFARALTFNYLSLFNGDSTFASGSTATFNAGSAITFKRAPAEEVGAVASVVTFEAKPYMKPAGIIPGVAPAGTCGPCAGPIAVSDTVIVPSAESFAGIIPLEQVTLNNGESFIIEFRNPYLAAADFILTNAIKGGYLNTAVNGIIEGPPSLCQILVTNVHATDNITSADVEIAFMLIGPGSTT